MGERMQTALRGGMRCSGRAAAWVPGVGRAGAGAASKTGGRAGGGWAARRSRPLRAHLRGCPPRSPRPRRLPRRPQPLSGKTHGLGGAAGGPRLRLCSQRPSNRCGLAAGAEGARGCGVWAGGAPLARGSGDREERCGGDPERPAPLSCLSPTSLHAHGAVLALGTGRARGRVPGGWGEPQAAGRWVGGGWRAGGAGEGKEGMPSHGACRARARRRPGADPMRAHVPRNADFPPETHGPLLKQPPLTGVPASLGLKAC